MWLRTTTRVSKEENSKLRDILKHALNEANTAKEAAEIAKVENSQLKDNLAEQEEALTSLKERMRITGLMRLLLLRISRS